MNETGNETPGAPVSGYGDEGAKMLAAAFIDGRFDQMEQWLHRRGLKSSFLQRWIKSILMTVGDRLEAPVATIKAGRQ